MEFFSKRLSMAQSSPALQVRIAAKRTKEHRTMTMNCEEERSQIYVFFSLYQQKKTWTLFNVLFIWFILGQSHQINYLPEVKYSSPPKVLKCIFANKSKQTLEMFPYLFRKHNFNLLKWVYLLFKDLKDITKAFGSSAFASC